MAQTATLQRNVDRIRGLLMAFGLDRQIRIAYDEWNLRSWHHPDVDTAPLGTDEFIRARAKADINATYTMADAVFNGCFLNMLLRNADIVGMAAYAPAVNTRGSIYVHDRGIVKRTTWHVFYLYTHLMGDQVLDSWTDGAPVATKVTKYDETYDVEMIDAVATRFSQSGDIAVSLVNKEPEKAHEVEINLPAGYRLDRMTTLRGHDKDDYNDVDRDAVLPEDTTGDARTAGATLKITLSPHSVNIVTLKAEK